MAVGWGDVSTRTNYVRQRYGGEVRAMAYNNGHSVGGAFNFTIRYFGSLG